MVEFDSVQGHKEYVISLAYSSQNNLVVSASNDGFVRIWGNNAADQLECIKEIFESEKTIRNILLIEEKDLLLINSWIQWMRIWKLSTKVKLGEHRDDTFGKALTVAENNNIVTGINFAGELKVWEIPN